MCYYFKMMRRINSLGGGMKKDNDSFTVVSAISISPIQTCYFPKLNISNMQIHDLPHSLPTQAASSLYAHPKSPDRHVSMMAESSLLFELVMRSTHWLTIHELSIKMGYKGMDVSSRLNKWKKCQRVLALNVDGKDLFPAYAFGLEGKPLPIMEKILILLSQNKTPLTIAIWFSSSNSWLTGKAPQEVLTTQPEEVFAAAQAEVNPIEHS